MATNNNEKPKYNKENGYLDHNKTLSQYDNVKSRIEKMSISNDKLKNINLDVILGMHPNLLAYISTFPDDMLEKLVVTSTTNMNGKRRTKGRHKDFQALDFGLMDYENDKGSFSGDMSKFTPEQISKLEADNIYNFMMNDVQNREKYGIVLEKPNHGTAPHVHIEYSENPRSRNNKYNQWGATPIGRVDLVENPDYYIKPDWMSDEEKREFYDKEFDGPYQALVNDSIENPSNKSSNNQKIKELRQKHQDQGTLNLVNDLSNSVNKEKRDETVQAYQDYQKLYGHFLRAYGENGLEYYKSRGSIDIDPNDFVTIYVPEGKDADPYIERAARDSGREIKTQVGGKHDGKKFIQIPIHNVLDGFQKTIKNLGGEAAKDLDLIHQNQDGTWEFGKDMKITPKIVNRKRNRDGIVTSETVTDGEYGQELPFLGYDVNNDSQLTVRAEVGAIPSVLSIDQGNYDFSNQANLVPKFDFTITKNKPIIPVSEDDKSEGALGGATVTNVTKRPEEMSKDQAQAILDQNKAPEKDVEDDMSYFNSSFNSEEPLLKSPQEFKDVPIPFAEIASGVLGLATGMGMANVDIPERDEKVGEALIQFANEYRKISKLGLSPEEEGAMKESLNKVYKTGLDNVVNNSNGNRNLILGNLGRLDSQAQEGMMQMALLDMQKRQEAMKGYQEIMTQIEGVNLGRDIANNERAYEQANKTAEAGAMLMQAGWKTIIDNIDNYKDNSPGGIMHSYKHQMYEKIGGGNPLLKNSVNNRGSVAWHDDQNKKAFEKATDIYLRDKFVQENFTDEEKKTLNKNLMEGMSEQNAYDDIMRKRGQNPQDAKQKAEAGMPEGMFGSDVVNDDQERGLKAQEFMSQSQPQQMQQPESMGPLGFPTEDVGPLGFPTEPQGVDPSMADQGQELMGQAQPSGTGLETANLEDPFSMYRYQGKNIRNKRLQDELMNNPFNTSNV